MKELSLGTQLGAFRSTHRMQDHLAWWGRWRTPLPVGLGTVRRCQAGGISEDTSSTLLKFYAWQLLCLSPQVPRCLLYPSVRQPSSKNSLPPHPLLCSVFNDFKSLVIKIQIM